MPVAVSCRMSNDGSASIVQSRLVGSISSRNTQRNQHTASAQVQYLLMHVRSGHGGQQIHSYPECGVKVAQRW